MNIEIRRARPEEAATLTEIALAAKRHWNYPEAWIQKWTPLLTFTPQKIEEAEVFVAAVDDELIGFYRLVLHSPRAILEDLWVKPGLIGNGVGRGLFQHAVARCQAAGLSLLELEAEPHAQGFYEKMGMVQVGEHPSDVDRQRKLPILEMKL